MGKVLAITPAGPDHQVITVEGDGRNTYCRQPCPTCPWRKDAVGLFPPEAFAHSARTAYDMSTHTFACHTAGVEKNATCAGFLLRGANHNLAVRIGYINGRFKDDVRDGGFELYDNYRAMAIANGVDPEDPALGPCRDD
jgi:hypothetical protein